MKARNIFLLFILLINFSFAHAETELPVLEKNSDEIVNENLLKPRSPHTKSNKYRKRMDDFEYHSADYNPRDHNINIRELLRVIQIYNYTGAYYCNDMSEDGYALGYGDLDNDYNCYYHSSDYEHYVSFPGKKSGFRSADWTIDMDELMRLIQLYNSSCYEVYPSSEDGYKPCEENFRKKYKFFFNNQSKKIKRTIKNEPQSLIAYHKLRKQSNNQYRIESKIEYTGYLTAIAIQILKPSNCLFVDASDDVEYKEFEDHIEFFWKDVPVSPISFSYMIESQTALSKKQIDAIAYYRFGAGNEQSQEVIYEDASVLATHSSQSYTPGELLEISNHIEYKIDLSELTLNVNLADGWIIHSYTGNDLPDKHIEYQNQFIWNKVPESSIDFSYHVKIPEDENGINIIKANIIYKDLNNIENLLTALPYPLLIYEAIPSIDTNWNLINPSISVNDLRCLWGNSPNDVFAVGKFGDIIHYDGASWKKMKTPTNLEFYGVWGCSHNEVFAVGNKYESDSWLYLIYFYDGYSWNEMFSKESGTLKGVWGNSYFDVFTVGSNGVIYHFNGSMWEMMQYQTTENLNDVWGVPGENVYAVGDEGTILKYNGLKWVKEENLLTDRLNAIWGDSNTNIYTVGINGTILNFNGETWNKITNTSVELNDIWGSSKNDIYAVGSEGVIYYFDGNNWSETYNPLSGSHNRIESVWGDKGKVFASASNGIILFFDGKNWVEMSNITSHNLNSIFYVPDLGMVSAGDYGIILCNNDQKWSEMNSNTLNHLNDLWGIDRNNIFAVGNNGTIIHYNGYQWSKMINTQGNHLKAVWGSSKTDVFAVGCNGKIMHFNGNKWKEISDSPVYNTECSLNDVWGKSKSDVLTVGTDGIMMHFNGDEWTKLNSITTQDLNAIWWASDHNVFVVGNKGTVLYYDGSIWSEMPTPFNDTHYHLNAIWGKSENDIFSAGGSLISSKILHYNGKNWKEETIPFTGTYVNLQDIYGSKRIFSVGKHGIILELPPSLMLSFLSDQFHEGDSFFLYVDVILDEVKEDDTIVFLKSSDSSEIITPETVTISSGYTYTTFKFEIVDDSILDGSQKLAITASLINNYSATNEIIIHDNEKALLSINIPKFAVEGEILPNQGVVFADKTVGKNTSVALVSSDISELVIPETVTIPAGMSSATFDLIAVEDKLNDGMQIVSVNAFVEGWESTSSQITIKDNAQDFFTEIFYDKIDLNKTVLTFTPDNTSNFYHLCRNDLTHQLVSYPEATQLYLTDDSFIEITLSQNEKINLFQIEYSSFYIGSNGYITFVSGDVSPKATLYDHFIIPRISALFDDLKPSNLSISWIQLSDKAVITYHNVEAYSGEGENNFQIEIYYDGVIKIYYETISSYGAICGLSSGKGVPDNFKQSDLSQYSQCENLFVSKNQVDETSVNHSIGMNLAAQFQKPSKDNNSVYYSVTTSSQIGGCITNSDNYIVCGTDKTISIVPENGFKIKDVIVDEISVGPVSHYTFWRISENHTIEALFVATEYKIISGKVISTDMGTGLGGYYVYVWNDQYQQLGMSKTDTSPDNIGYYIINELEPSNNLLMEVRPPDVNADYSGIFYNQQNYWSKADNISTLNGNLTDINFSLPRNSKFGFRGIVHDGTNGLNNVIVSIFSENTGFHKYVQTNSLGCYYVTNLEPSDSYIVSTYSKLYDKTFYYNILKNQILGEKPNFSTFLADYARKVYPDYPAISNIDIVTDISSNSIQGCVLSDSLPVSGVWVNAWSPELGNGNGAFTNSNGHYDINGLSDITFDDIPINGYIVEIDSKDYYYQAYNAVDQRDNAILVGSNSNSINFILVKKNSESISGIIEDESGQKIEGIFIKAWSEIEHSGGNAVSNENGFYEIFELEKSNDYIVTAQPHWTTSYQDDQKINISSGSDNVNFSIKQNVPGLYIIEGIITDCFEQNVSGADVEIYSNKRNFTYNVTTNSSGFYKITDIPSSDDYVLKVFPDNNSSNAFYREQDIFINFNAEKNIILGQGKKISGAVYSYNNLPLENVVMTISSEKKGYYCQLLTNRNGSYTANNLPESFDYIITATPEKNSQYSNQKKINRAPQIGINFILSRGGTISGCIKDATTGAFLQGVIVNIYSKTMLGLYGYNTTTISNTDGEYFAHNLLSHDQHGNALDNYVVTAFKEDYPPQAGGGKKVGDTVDFILTKSTMNELSGIVQGYSSGELLNYEVVIKIFTNNGKFLFNDIVDENGHFNVYSLQSNVKYQLKFLAFVDGIEIMNQWAGKNDLGVQRREDAKTYSTASTVNFKFNDKLRSKPRTLNEQYSRVVQNIRKIYSISNNNQSQLSINIRFEWAPCVPKDSDETYYSRFLNQPDFIFSDRNTRRKTPINNLSIDQNFSGDEETYYFCIAAADRNGTPYATKTIDFQVDTIAPYNVKISVAQQQYEQNILLHLNAIGAYDIYLSNDGFGINGQWEKYQLEKNWLLNSDSANSTIYCLFRDNYQNISKQLLEIPYVPVTNEYSLDDVIRILKILSRIETSISYFPDITNEKKLALPDVIFLLQNLSK